VANVEWVCVEVVVIVVVVVVGVAKLGILVFLNAVEKYKGSFRLGYLQVFTAVEARCWSVFLFVFLMFL